VALAVLQDHLRRFLGTILFFRLLLLPAVDEVVMTLPTLLLEVPVAETKQAKQVLVRLVLPIKVTLVVLAVAQVMQQAEGVAVPAVLVLLELLLAATVAMVSHRLLQVLR
jgi:hypothetical protein